MTITITIEEKLKSEITPKLFDWAEKFFTGNNLNNYISREKTHEDFMKSTNQKYFTSSKFKNELQKYFDYKGYELNPKALQNFRERIVMRFEGKAQEVFFVRKNKTPEEIQKLKQSWHHDPIWDIEETEGFEAHKEELKAYRISVENEWKERKNKKILEKAETMGIPENIKLAEYILKLEMNIDFQLNKIEKLELLLNN